MRLSAVNQRQLSIRRHFEKNNKIVVSGKQCFAIYHLKSLDFQHDFNRNHFQFWHYVIIV